MIAVLTLMPVTIAGSGSLIASLIEPEVSAVLRDYFPLNPLTLACFADGPLPQELTTEMTKSDMFAYLISTPELVSEAVRLASEKVPIEIAPESRERCLSGVMSECYRSITTFADLTDTLRVEGIPDEIEPLFRLNRVLAKLNVTAVRALIGANLPVVIHRALFRSRGTPFYQELLTSTSAPGSFFADAAEPVRSLLEAESAPILGLEGLFDFPSKIASYSMNRQFWLSFYSATTLDEVYASIATFFRDYTEFYSVAGGLHFIATFPGAAPISPRCRQLVEMATRHEISDLEDMLRHFDPVWALRLRGMIPAIDPQAPAPGVDVWAEVAGVIRLATDPLAQHALTMSA